MKEIWKPIPNYEGLYEASSHGRIRSVNRIIEGRWGATRRTGKIRSCHLDKDGYQHLHFRGKHHRVSRLVCETFHGPSPFEAAQVNHKNKIRNDDTIKNLEWVSQSENMQHAYE